MQNRYLTLAGAQGHTHLEIIGRVQTEENVTLVLALCSSAGFFLSVLRLFLLTKLCFFLFSSEVTKDSTVHTIFDP